MRAARALAVLPSPIVAGFCESLPTGPRPNLRTPRPPRLPPPPAAAVVPASLRAAGICCAPRLNAGSDSRAAAAAARVCYKWLCTRADGFAWGTVILTCSAAKN